MTLISCVAVIMIGSLVYKDEIVDYITPSSLTSTSQSIPAPTPPSELDPGLATSPDSVPSPAPESTPTPAAIPTPAPTPTPIPAAVPSSTPTPAAVPSPAPTPTQKSAPKPTPAPTATASRSTAPSQAQLTADQQHMLDLINQERSKAGLGPLKIDSKLQTMAQAKSDDMVAKAYFDHTSPTYGSPFEMMKKFGISYTSAGENIAGNSSVDKAHAALMNSPGHKANILKASFNYIGIGVTASPKYGKMFAQDFVGR